MHHYTCLDFVAGVAGLAQLLFQSIEWEKVAFTGKEIILVLRNEYVVLKDE